MVSTRTVGICAPVRITSFTYRRRRPKAPAGCERAKSSSVKPRAFNSATASASPTASAAVVLAVGARFNGQASAGTRMSKCTVARRASAESEFPVKAINGNAEPLDHGQYGENFSRFAGIRQRQHRIVAGDHADIAVTGLAGMHEKRRRAGAGESGGDFPADMAGLAHAGHHDTAPAVKTNPAGTCKIRPEAGQLRAQTVDLDG